MADREHCPRVQMAFAAEAASRAMSVAVHTVEEQHAARLAAVHESQKAEAKKARAG